MKTIIVGAGEIGKSLLKVLGKQYDCHIIDNVVEDNPEEYEIMHVCFTYSDKFIDYVKEYQDRYKPKYTVIHSTVPIGVSEKCDAIHSPVTGIHPHLEESLTIFTKFLGGSQASEVAQYFRRAGIKVYLTDKSETTELMKVLCTTFYGLNIEYTKEIKRLCDRYNVPFEFWTIWNDNYNTGYQKLGYPEYTRQNLVPIMTSVGGHCVIPNLKLVDSPFTKFIDEMNRVKE